MNSPLEKALLDTMPRPLFSIMEILMSKVESSVLSNRASIPSICSFSNSPFGFRSERRMGKYSVTWWGKVGNCWVLFQEDADICQETNFQAQLILWPREQMNRNLWYWVIVTLWLEEAACASLPALEAGLGASLTPPLPTANLRCGVGLTIWHTCKLYSLSCHLSESHLLLVALFLLARMVFFGVSDICFSFCRGLHKPGSFTLQQSSCSKQWQPLCFEVFDDVGWGRRLVLKYFPTW